MDVSRATAWAGCLLACSAGRVECVWKTESRIKNGECRADGEEETRGRKDMRKRDADELGSTGPNAAECTKRN